MPSVTFKTDARTLPGVLEHVKHALQIRPKLAPGDIILIAQTLQTLQRGQKQIRYRMSFVRSYADRNGETDKIWGRHWNYVIEGENLEELRRPFNVREVQVTHRNYEQGGPTVHVDPRDEQALRSAGYLEPIRDALR